MGSDDQAAEAACGDESLVPGAQRVPHVARDQLRPHRGWPVTAWDALANVN